jgi:hypothetical protein
MTGAGLRAHIRCTASASRPVMASDPTISTAICQVQSWLTPNATELLRQCSAMHGYSDPVRSYSTQSAKPKKASGTRNAGSDEPAWIDPNTTPVRIAAGHFPRQLRSALKK